MRAAFGARAVEAVGDGGGDELEDGHQEQAKRKHRDNEDDKPQDDPDHDAGGTEGVVSMPERFEHDSQHAEHALKRYREQEELHRLADDGITADRLRRFIEAFFACRALASMTSSCRD